MKITSLTIIDEPPHNWAEGDTLLATFDYQDAGYLFKDALLIRGGRSGQLIAQPPKGETRKGRRAVMIEDAELREELAAAAYAVFAAMGGVEEEAA